MDYKDTFKFICSCLALDVEANRKYFISQIDSSIFDWDSVVKLSTKQLVFPAVYFNLKKYDFLKLLPDDLVEYMRHISDLNRERNESIVKQSKEVNELLKNNNISPIFIKGASHLLMNLYEDKCQRMVGDIDFLVSEEDYLETISILKDNGYKKVYKDKIEFLDARHYPRLVKDNEIAAIEVHKNLLRPNKLGVFNYEIIKKDILTKDNVNHLSIQNQIKYNILTNQINDYGLLLKTFSLRKAHDILLLLSLLTKPIDLEENGKKFKKIFDKYLNTCYLIFNKPKILFFNFNEVNEKVIKKYLRDIYGISNTDLKEFFIKSYLYFNYRLKIISFSFFNSDHRKWVLKKMQKKIFLIERN